MLPESIEPRLAHTLNRCGSCVRKIGLRSGGGPSPHAHALSVKYPNAGRELGWQWVFPSKRFSEDPRSIGDSGGPVLRRHHVAPDILQKAVKAAAQRAGIRKPVNCHGLRHSFATHFSENGADIRSVHELLGHASIDTTMISLHVAKVRGVAGVRSPLD